MNREIERLIEGYHHFRHTYIANEETGFKDLVRNGQRPKVLMIACSDSRVDPALVMGCEPGDLFVIRNVANLVPPYEDDGSYHGTSAALEFGVCGLEIHHIILFGHTQCGGIQALIEHPLNPCQKMGFISKWMELAMPAYDAVQNRHPNASLDEKVTHCGHYSLINSLNNLKSFPWIRERVDQGTLFLHAWNFDMARAQLEAYRPEKGQFEDIV